MKFCMISGTIISAVLSVVFWVVDSNSALTVTFVTIFYHLAMRLLVGTVINAIYRNRIDHNKWWFRERRFERKLYKALGVNRWKKSMPTYDEQAFDFSTHTAAELLGTMCQAELVHEVILLLSFVPLIFSLWWDDFLVFLLTSIAAAAADGVFVIMQRYNRPRVLRLAGKSAR